MPWYLYILALPRVVLLLVFLFTTFIMRAYHGMQTPLLGFFFLPLTMLVYAWIVNSGASVQGIYLAAIIICVPADPGLLGHTAGGRRD